MSWEDDPVERHWERRLDRADGLRASEDYGQRIRGEADLRAAHRRVIRPRSELARDTAWRHVVEERDALRQRLADCDWLDDAVRQSWIDRIGEIGPMGADPAEVEQLSDDIADACATVRHSLVDIAGGLVRDSDRQDDGRAPLVALLRAKEAARSKTVAARSGIGSCVHLNARVRAKWASMLPEPDEGLRWLTSTGPGTAASLRQAILDLSETVARFASRMRDGFTVIKVELDKLSTR